MCSTWRPLFTLASWRPNQELTVVRNPHYWDQARVRLQEVIAYKARTDIDRRAALDELAREARELKLGYDE